MESIFPFELKFFFFQNHPFQAFLVSKDIYFHTFKKMSANSSGGGGSRTKDASFLKCFFTFLCFKGEQYKEETKARMPNINRMVNLRNTVEKQFPTRASSTYTHNLTFVS